MDTIFDLIIIGGGPAGSAAAVYAGRKKLKTLMITSEFGGQSSVSPDIQNWIGDPHISGNGLAQKFENHVKEYAGNDLQIKTASAVTNLSQKEDKTFKVELSSGEIVNSKTVLISTGSKRRQLPAKGADIFEHRGLTYCASCDGLFFAVTLVEIPYL
jgi:alkyl hydroperoxide reductase subunit AhpF